MKELLKQYFDFQKKIHDFFGYVEDGETIPIEDTTEYYWLLKHDEYRRNRIYFSNQPLTVESINKDKNLYSDIIHMQQFIPEWVHRAERYTMIYCDTHTDGNKYLRIFDNDKELTNPTPEQITALKKWDFYKG